MDSVPVNLCCPTVGGEGDYPDVSVKIAARLCLVSIVGILFRSPSLCFTLHIIETIRSSLSNEVNVFFYIYFCPLFYNYSDNVA